MLCIPFFFYFLGLKNPKDVDPKLMVPIFDIMFPFLPEKILKPLRFGVRYHDVSISNLLDFSLTVKAATLIFISGCGLAISSAKEGKSGFIYNLVKS